MVPRFLYPLLPYRSMLGPFLVLSALVVPSWLVVRLYRRSHGHRLSIRREALLLIVVLYLSGLASATLTPNRPSRQVAETMRGVVLQPDVGSLTCSSATMRSGPTARAFCIRNARGNLLLFVPLGLLLPLVWRRLRVWQGVLIAVALSASIEIIQLVSRAWGSYRSADVNDLLLNVAGACAGLAIAALLRFARVPAFARSVSGRRQTGAG